jgi:antitoxin VapB
MVALNIKNEEAARLAKELAERKGESMTTVVIEALRAELKRMGVASSRPGLAERLLSIGTNSPDIWDEPNLSTRHGDLLYDEYGLPM